MKILENFKIIMKKIFGTSVVLIIALIVVSILISIFKKNKNDDNYIKTKDLLDKINEKMKEVEIKREEIKKKKEEIKVSIISIKDRHKERKEKAKNYIKDI